MAIVALAVLLMLVAIIGSLAMPRLQATALDVAWLAGRTDSAPPEADVYARYLARHRRHRYVGGLFGTLFAIVVGIRWYSRVSIGIGDGSPLGDILFCGLAGVLVGALSAETFRLSEPQSTTVFASMADRTAMAPPELVRLARIISIAAVIFATLLAVTGKGWASLVIAVASLMLAVVAEATRSAIAGRRRPVLSDSARAVDERIRSFAATSVGWLQLAAAILGAGWVLAKAENVTNDASSVLRFVLVIACLVLTVLFLRLAAPHPPRRWKPTAQ